jgi:tRNA threonylcarbamoyladenosine modification (KEOPS) complex Cgi121 subunit
MVFSRFSKTESKIITIIEKIKNNGIRACLLDPEWIYSQTHLDVAYQMAIQSFEDKENISDDLAVEFMLWLCACTQTSKAIEKCGAKNKDAFVFVSLEKDEKKAGEDAQMLEIELIDYIAKDRTEVLGKYGLDEENGILDIIETMALSRVNK